MPRDKKKVNAPTKKKFKEKMKGKPTRNFKKLRYKQAEVFLGAYQASSEGRRLKGLGYITSYKVRGPNRYGEFRLYVRVKR